MHSMGGLSGATMPFGRCPRLLMGPQGCVLVMLVGLGVQETWVLVLVVLGKKGLCLPVVAVPMSYSKYVCWQTDPPAEPTTTLSSRSAP